MGKTNKQTGAGKTPLNSSLPKGIVMSAWSAKGHLPHLQMITNGKSNQVSLCGSLTGLSQSTVKKTNSSTQQCVMGEGKIIIGQ